MVGRLSTWEVRITARASDLTDEDVTSLARALEAFQAVMTYRADRQDLLVIATVHAVDGWAAISRVAGAMRWYTRQYDAQLDRVRMSNREVRST